MSNMKRTAEQIVQDFNSLPILEKIRKIYLAEDMDKEADIEKKIIDDCLIFYLKEYHTIVMKSEDYIIVKTAEEYTNLLDFHYTPFVKEFGKWKATNLYYRTFEEALLISIGYKFEGRRSKFGRYAWNMLGKE